MNKNIILTFIAVVVVGAGGFVGGMQYQKSQVPQFGNGNFQRQLGNGQAPNMMRGAAMTGQPVSGEIISKDETSITVKMNDGSSKIVILSDETTINKTSEGSTNDLVAGDQVTAFGNTNSDGTVTAQSVAIGTGFVGRMMNNPPAQN